MKWLCFPFFCSFYASPFLPLDDVCAFALTSNTEWSSESQWNQFGVCIGLFVCFIWFRLCCYYYWCYVFFSIIMIMIIFYDYCWNFFLFSVINASLLFRCVMVVSKIQIVCYVGSRSPVIRQRLLLCEWLLLLKIWTASVSYVYFVVLRFPILFLVW